MKFPVTVFDENFKIAFYIAIEYFMNLFYIMDLLKIFRMQEPVPKDLLSKNPEIGKYREVVQEKDVLLRNCKVQIRDLEQQVAELEVKNRELELRVDPKKSVNIVKEYEVFYSKIMSESEQLMAEKQKTEAKLRELEYFCKDLMEKFEKAKGVIEHYEEIHKTLRSQVLEYEGIISSLTEEYTKLKEHMQNGLGAEEYKTSLVRQNNFKELLLKSKLKKEYSDSMFEPLKGLDK